MRDIVKLSAGAAATGLLFRERRMRTLADRVE